MNISCALARCYNLPGVSNVVDQYERVMGDTNYCNKVRSGEMKREMDSFMNEIESVKAYPAD